MFPDDSLLTPIIITHYSPKKEYGDLKPPSSGLVEKTVSSMRSKLNRMSSLLKCEPILVYNRPQNQGGEGPYRYYNNLFEASDRLGLEFHSLPNQGLREGILTALMYVDTKYVLFLEHDWVFLKSIDIVDIIREMENDDSINYIRFNKRRNIEQGWDTIVIEDDEKSIPLCKTSCFSNNPSIVRKEIFHNWVISSKPSFRTLWLKATNNNATVAGRVYDILRIIKDKYLLKQPHVSQFDDVEYVLDRRYKCLIRDNGFQDAHSTMGIYLYGGKGDGPFVKHLGGDY